MTEDESDLPEGWGRVALGELLQPNGLFDGPFGSSLKSSDYTPSGVRVIRLENVANLRFVAEKKSFISPEKYAGLAKHTVRGGDIIVGSFLDGAPRVCVLPELDTLAIAKADCFCVRPDAALIDRAFLAYQVGATQTVNHLVGEIHGATRPRITTKQLRLLPLVLPPLAEQNRIVAAVETVVAKVSSARERLERVPTTMKRFRQSVLAAACSGRLTADWREKKAGAADAAALLATLGIAPLSEVVPDEDLPESWAWVRFGDVLAEFKNGLSTKPNQSPPGTPILRINAVRPCEVSFADLRYLDCSADQKADYAIRNGDLLFTRYNGSLDFLGVCGLVRGINGEVLVYPDKLMRGRLRSPLILAEYCEKFFSSPAARERMVAKATSSAGQNGVSGSDVKSQPLALPPTDEQQEIVRRVSALFALADSFEQRAVSALKRVESLTQAVLAKAFRGELVPTEAELARREKRTYETADELLARIRATPAAVAKPKRARKATG